MNIYDDVANSIFKFDNGSEVKILPSGNIRGERSNFYETECLDLETDEFISARIDMRKPLDRHIPVWMIEKQLEEKMGLE